MLRIHQNAPYEFPLRGLQAHRCSHARITCQYDYPHRLQGREEAVRRSLSTFNCFVMRVGICRCVHISFWIRFSGATNSPPKISTILSRLLLFENSNKSFFYIGNTLIFSFTHLMLCHTCSHEVPMYLPCEAVVSNIMRAHCGNITTVRANITGSAIVGYHSFYLGARYSY